MNIVEFIFEWFPQDLYIFVHYVWNQCSLRRYETLQHFHIEGEGQFIQLTIKVQGWIHALNFWISWFWSKMAMDKMLHPIVWQIWPKLRLSKPNSVWFLWTSRYVVVSLIWRTVEVLLETLLLSVSSCFVRTKSCFPRFKNLQWIRKSLAQRLMLDCLFSPVLCHSALDQVLKSLVNSL